MANNNDEPKKESLKDFLKDSALGETLKKVISSGSPTEISKEILHSVIGQVLKAKDDITLKATHEMISIIQKIDFVNEFSKFAENHKFKVSAEIEIIKKSDESLIKK